MVSKFYLKMFLHLLPNTSINVIYMAVVEFYSLLLIKLVFLFPSVALFSGFLAAKLKPIFKFFSSRIIHKIRHSLNQQLVSYVALKIAG